MKKISLLLFLACLVCVSFAQQSFFEMCASGTPEQVQKALQSGADPNSRNDEGNTALMIAASRNDNPEVITMLVNAGADIDARSSEYARTALMYAAWENWNPEVIRALIHAGAEVNVQDNDGVTVLMHAAKAAENYEIIFTLLKAGADGMLKSKDGKTAYDYVKDNPDLCNEPLIVSLLELVK